MANNNSLTFSFLLVLLTLFSLPGCDSKKNSSSENVYPLVPLEGADNFRDIGGYKTVSGRVVKEGLIYRAGTLTDVTGEDIAKIKQLGIKTIIDFRDAEEVSAEPEPSIVGVTMVQLPIHVEGLSRDSITELIFSGDIPENHLVDGLHGVNEQLVRKFSREFRELMLLLQNEKNRPLVYHCSAGKDRTGFATAIFLSVLGVSKEDIIRDYLMSNQYLTRYRRDGVNAVRLLSLFRIGEEEVAPLFEVRRAYLETAFRTIDDEYGSMDNYLFEALGISPAVREKLVEQYTREG